MASADRTAWKVVFERFGLFPLVAVVHCRLLYDLLQMTEELVWELFTQGGPIGVPNGNSVHA